jgi:hypothetical protein
LLGTYKAQFETDLSGWTRFAGTLLNTAMLSRTSQAVRHRLYSDDESIGFRRDRTQHVEPPKAKIPIRMRPLEERDIPAVLDEDPSTMTPDERWEQVTRRRFLDSGIGVPHVAADADDEACYVQWLMGARDNVGLQRYFGGSFPILGPDEALVEGAYTPKRSRGLGIMSVGTYLLAEAAEKIGARYVHTFVGRDNIPSLKGCLRAGFVPHVVRRQTWRAFHRQTSFTPAPAGILGKL